MTQRPIYSIIAIELASPSVWVSNAMSIAPSQILYLEHGSSRLYAEAIQIVEARRLCWARPTLLICGLPETKSSDSADRQAAIAQAAAHPESSALSLYDLKDCPDLIWPATFFSIAFDIDFFTLLIQIKLSPDDSHLRSQAQLSEFIRSFWLTHADTFRSNLAKSNLPKPELSEIEKRNVSPIRILSS